MKKDIFEKLPDALLSWYAEHKRDLPWRNTSDPYRIWVSEIMLQQTRVEAVKGYYSRFLEALPTILSLANADDELLYKLWEGLGYYSRVRNMKKAAQVIVDKYGGEFPGEYADVLSLPGIGPYTAGAVCSIAFNKKTPAVDGNVLRVIARLTNDRTPIDDPTFKRQIQDSLQTVYPNGAGAFTQALMELGATVCGPNRKPECDSCPCVSFCEAHREGTMDLLPIKNPKRERRTEKKTVFVLRCGDMYALEKRPDQGLLAGMWQFPDRPGKLELNDALAEVKSMGLSVSAVSLRVERKHIFTHVVWDMTGVYVDVTEPGGGYTWLTAEQIEKDAGLPTAYRMFWDELKKYIG